LTLARQPPRGRPPDPIGDALINNSGMPLFEYACRDCGRHFEYLTREGQSPACPACASAALEKRGLQASVAGEEFSDTVPEGAVISQDPSTGTLFRGDTVSYVVSQGPELVEVPQVKAMGVEAATELLEGLGFEVRTEESDLYLGIGYVSSSDPGAGEQVAKGSTITLFLV